MYKYKTNYYRGILYYVGFSLHNIFAFHYIDSIELPYISAYQICEIANLSSLRFVIPARCRCYQLYHDPLILIHIYITVVGIARRMIVYKHYTQ